MNLLDSVGNYAIYIHMIYLYFVIGFVCITSSLNTWRCQPVFFLNSALIQLLPVCKGNCGAYVLVDVPQWPSRLPFWLQVGCIFLTMTRWAERQEFWETMGSIASDRWWSGWSKRLLLLEVCFVDSFRSKVVDCPTLLRGPAMTNLFVWLMVKLLVLICWVGHQ